MEINKIIPQFYYDLLSRVLPGFTLILLFSASLNANVFRHVNQYLDESSALQDSSFAMILFYLLVSYLIGQLLSPLSSFFEQNIVAKLFPKNFNLLKNIITGKDLSFPPEIIQFIEDETNINKDNLKQEDDTQLRKYIFIWYDWLKIYKPEIGANIVKMRAQASMHVAITLITLLSIVVYLAAVSLDYVEIDVLHIAFYLLIIFLCLWGTIRTHKMFRWGVISHYYICKSSNP
ncbi:MAG: hypothetical protein GY839_20025 [candidate division Zixibacteria bacterium]|nr:hypothetical protein [candidate division Zixibacteria bacterium]